MTGLHIDTVVLPGEMAQRVDYPADTIWLRAAGHGDIQVADYTSVDRQGPPAHSHPWDEVQIVVDGYVEFLVNGGLARRRVWDGAAAAAWRPTLNTDSVWYRAHHPGFDWPAVRRVRQRHGPAVRRRRGFG